MLSRSLSAGRDLLCPPVCWICEGYAGRAVGAVCAGCRPQLVAAHQCRRCGTPAPRPVSRSGCPVCRDATLSFSSAVSLGGHRGVLRELVLQLKGRGGESAAVAVGRLLGERIVDHDPAIPWDCVVPVPMHWSRRWLRSRVPSEILAEQVAAVTGVRWNRQLLRCARRTRKQGRLGPTERRANVRNAYRLSSGYALREKHILLVDDVMTTGATAQEAARCLRRGGAAAVDVAVAARGLPRA